MRSLALAPAASRYGSASCKPGMCIAYRPGFFLFLQPLPDRLPAIFLSRQPAPHSGELFLGEGDLGTGALPQNFDEGSLMRRNERFIIVVH